jgi:hypothetical protein
VAGTESQTPQTDPYDLGDTSRQMPETPPRDPATGRFVAQQPTPSATPPATPSAPDWLVEQARQVGIPEDAITGLDARALNVAVKAALDAQRATQQQLFSQWQQARQQQAPAQPAPAAPAVDELAQIESVFDKYDYEPDFKGALKTLVKAARKGHEALAEAKALRDEVTKGFEQRDQLQIQRQRLSSHQILNAAFAKLVQKHPECKELFGEGPAEALNPQSPELQCRRDALTLGGINPDDVNPHTVVSQLSAVLKRWQRAAPAVAPPNPYTQPAAQPPISEERWMNGGTARPTSRNGAAEPNGRQKAVDNLRAKMREVRGDNEEAGDSELLDTLLG